ncbi:MAG: aldehyde dehydrogenase family protein [Acidimicrobiales bacterium]
MPDGWLNVVTCDDDVAPRLVEHPDVAVISFTGSAAVGWAIAAAAPASPGGPRARQQRTGHHEADADLALAAAKVAAGGFAFAGQTCIAVQRVYVHEAVHGRFLDELVPRVQRLVCGDPLDPTTDVSALITGDDTRRVHGIVEAAVGGGATIRCGGTVDDRGVLAPTVLDGVTADMAVCREEVFGPVVGVAPYASFDEAVALANDTSYGLQAAVFTASLGRALDAAHRLEFGGVLVNEMPTFRADQMPYGGVKASGNTREGPAYAVDELTERRLVVLPR